MAGSRDTGTFSSNRTAEELLKLVRKSEAAATDAVFDGRAAETLGNLLGVYNGRDAELVRNRLDALMQNLEGSIEGAFSPLFGGSVAKHTYVDGLSDIDSLVILNDTALEDQSPQRALDRIEKIILDKSKNGVTVTRGRMAVTVTYPDGMVIQLLPALRTKESTLRVPSSRRDGWSHIDPDAFRAALTKRNDECGKKLVPTIKLAKAIIGTLPEDQRLSGYHVESLAISAFKGYGGPATTLAMLPAFFEQAKSLVLAPIKDSTGQSVHVDEYLGDAGSEPRQAASHIMARLGRRIRNALAAQSVSQLRDLFGTDDV